MAGTGCPFSATANEMFFPQASEGEAGVCAKLVTAVNAKTINRAIGCTQASMSGPQFPVCQELCIFSGFLQAHRKEARTPPDGQTWPLDPSDGLLRGRSE